MLKRFMLLGGLTALAIAALVWFAGSQPVTVTAGPTPSDALQNFDIDVITCINDGSAPAAVKSTGSFLTAASCGSETLTAGAAAVVTTVINIPAGRRLGLPFSYSGPGWTNTYPAACAPGTLSAACAGAIVGGVSSQIDLLCDSNVDTFADASNIGTPEHFATRTVAWGAGTGLNLSDESFLDANLPPASIMARIWRYRADIDTIYLNSQGSPLVLALTNPVPLNTVGLEPSWSLGAGVQQSVYDGGRAAAGVRAAEAEAQASRLAYARSVRRA